MTAEPMTPERLAHIRQVTQVWADHWSHGYDPFAAAKHRVELLALVDDLATELEGQADVIERQLSDLETARHERDHHEAEADRFRHLLDLTDADAEKLRDLLADADDQLDKVITERADDVFAEVCGGCAHVHAPDALGGICVGCPCLVSL